MGPSISGGGGGSIVGDVLGLGVGIAAAGNIAPQVSEMIKGISPNNNSTNTIPTQPQINFDTWQCSCGNANATGNFCNMCGVKKPEQNIISDAWDCSCGNTGIIGNFCNMCGKKRGE